MLPCQERLAARLAEVALLQTARVAVVLMDTQGLFDTRSEGDVSHAVVRRPPLPPADCLWWDPLCSAVGWDALGNVFNGVVQ